MMTSESPNTVECLISCGIGQSFEKLDMSVLNLSVLHRDGTIFLNAYLNLLDLKWKSVLPPCFLEYFDKAVYDRISRSSTLKISEAVAMNHL